MRASQSKSKCTVTRAFTDGREEGLQLFRWWCTPTRTCCPAGMSPYCPYYAKESACLRARALWSSWDLARKRRERRGRSICQRVSNHQSIASYTDRLDNFDLSGSYLPRDSLHRWHVHGMPSFEVAMRCSSSSSWGGGPKMPGKMKPFGPGEEDINVGGREPVRQSWTLLIGLWRKEPFLISSICFCFSSSNFNDRARASSELLLLFSFSLLLLCLALPLLSSFTGGALAVEACSRLSSMIVW